MPVKRVMKHIYYKCNICGRDWTTIDDARKCERQKPIKMPLAKGGTRTDLWEIGDLVLCYNRSDEREWMLGIISGTQIEGHNIMPVIETTDTPAQQYSSWTHRNLILLDEDLKRKVKRWADIIASHPTEVA